MKKAVFVLILCLSFNSTNVFSMTCLQALGTEQELIALPGIPFNRVTVLNTKDGVRSNVSLVFEEWFDLSYEYDETGKRTSLIGLTADGKIYHFVKNEESHVGFARLLSGEHRVLDIRVSSRGAILMKSASDDQRSFVFAAKYFFKGEEDSPAKRMLKRVFGDGLEKDGFYESGVFI